MAVRSEEEVVGGRKGRDVGRKTAGGVADVGNGVHQAGSFVVMGGGWADRANRNGRGQVSEAVVGFKLDSEWADASRTEMVSLYCPCRWSSR
jgi:hypothetical protein